jgi:hypothetical protein
LTFDHCEIVFKKLEEELELVRVEDQAAFGVEDVSAEEIDEIAELVRVVADVAEPEVHFHTSS